MRWIGLVARKESGNVCREDLKRKVNGGGRKLIGEDKLGKSYRQYLCRVITTGRQYKIIPLEKNCRGLMYSLARITIDDDDDDDDDDDEDDDIHEPENVNDRLI